MWCVAVAIAAIVIAGLVFAAVLILDKFTPLSRHPLYESVFDQVQELEARQGSAKNVERRS